MLSLTTLRKSGYEKVEVKRPLLSKKSKFTMVQIKNDSKKLKFKIAGEMFYPPAKQEHDQYGVKYTMGVKFSADDCEIFDKCLDGIEEQLQELGESDWERKETHDDGSIFLKLGTNKSHSEFSFSNNLQLKPTCLNHDKLDSGMDVQVELELGGWLMRVEGEKKYGLTLSIKSIHFGALEKKKKRKVEEDDVRVNL